MVVHPQNGLLQSEPCGSAAEVERTRVTTLLTRRKSAINSVKKALPTARICQITLGLLS
jgi:hypothetical protein